MGESSSQHMGTSPSILQDKIVQYEREREERVRAYDREREERLNRFTRERSDRMGKYEHEREERLRVHDSQKSEIESLHAKLVEFESRLSAKLGGDSNGIGQEAEDPQKQILEELVTKQKKQMDDQQKELQAMSAAKDDEIRRLHEKLEEVSKMVATNMAAADHAAQGNN